ncbi:MULTISPECIES: dihydrolipoamide acetyltransferase family protein [unclassified Pseudomonas]|uniref:dihydrolipoamide acetyltransferase family protein n=1 Tax=unclassified Pseudomonas TaxID=196821 RepID=UPI000BD85A6E|nr:MULTISPECIES: dihydrolipoamide acetyltransferase family protein [unclassified Pseudomonas]PVZ19986.1 2-oxoisovalerate dehydrogenase E2 component (dihydrolipoyl transacylase) [Pseudomonas sp. URIL14HWK12:I12]PVZ27052.1 2-oxoisovalerate dehydrogenase E2 component (dihydrolipoyl transacylase) [Pseudomonas sp. URIL14HWK12:I10]PVZ37941.1 2-oxoisovalerate dehydrogenase E2 component (dihydrolipoyl transacylase) [Pseudomonas sp. URIL14HWK12:I11]SNZ05054.1 branched-chain alpha-keto acid dehydrogenase
MGTHVIKMPDIGEGIAQVELVEWLVAVGETVTEDQALADVMTDKATVQIPSPVSGKVLALGAEPGAVMAVGSELIRLEVEGRGNAAERPAAPASASASAGQAPEAIPSSRPEPEPAPLQAPTPPSKVHAQPSSTSRPLASPAVRQRAMEAGIDLAKVPGTGPAGRIEHADLDAALASNRPKAAPADAIELVPVIGLRRKIAERMQQATRNAAHFSYVEEIDVTALEATRAQLNTRYGETRGHLTVLPLLARALVIALRDFPQLNARYDDQAQVVERYRAVHLGIATQGDQGLLVPVLRHAEAGSLWDNARAIAALADSARHGRAPREALGGSTITLTSLGALGGIVSTPVLNLPEVAIVGVNRIVERPVVVAGQIVVRRMMNLSSSFDHRVVDGMDAARFIQAVRLLLEQPALLLAE